MEEENVLHKWICNKCGYETSEKPDHKNATCPNCKQGRFRGWNLCKCGKWFHPQRLSQQYCSEECGYIFKQNGGKKGKKYPHLQRAKIVICPVCGKEFRAVKDCYNRHSVYCSKECWSKRVGTVEKECEHCGKVFISYANREQKYCSKHCADEVAKTRTGELSPKWEGGKTAKSKVLRTRAEYREWRLAVFKRDNFTCQKCGKRTRDLEAHHIKESCNHPELIYDVNNGITLCHACHKETDNYGWKARWSKAELIEE